MTYDLLIEKFAKINNKEYIERIAENEFQILLEQEKQAIKNQNKIKRVK